MRSQINLGRVFGIRIGLHYSWFIIAFLILFSLSGQFHTSNPEWGDSVILALAGATAILFFVSLLLHELAHSVVAKSRGLPVREITLFALGGVSQIEKEPTSAKMEFWMAFVGPLTSACIGLFCLALSRLPGTPSSPITAMVSWLGYINLALAGELLRGAMEVLDKSLLDAQVSFRHKLGVITTLEFLQHHFSLLGHRGSPCDPTVPRPLPYCRPFLRTRSVRRVSGLVQTGICTLAAMQTPKKLDCLSIQARASSPTTRTRTRSISVFSRKPSASSSCLSTTTPMMLPRRSSTSIATN